MAYSTQDLDKIKAAIASGKLELQLNGRRVRYQSIGDMIKAKTIIEQDLASQAVANGDAPPRRFFRTRTNSGL